MKTLIEISLKKTAELVGKLPLLESPSELFCRSLCPFPSDAYRIAKVFLLNLFDNVPFYPR